MHREHYLKPESLEGPAAIMSKNKEVNEMHVQHKVTLWT